MVLWRPSDWPGACLSRSVSEPLSITSFSSMPLEEVEQHRGDSGSGEEELQSDSMPCCQTFQSDDHGSSLDSDGGGDAKRKFLKICIHPVIHPILLRTRLYRNPSADCPLRARESVNQFNVLHQIPKSLKLSVTKYIRLSARLDLVVRGPSGRMLRNGV